jgi:predicted RND superfamily exporter protein
MNDERWLTPVASMSKACASRPWTVVLVAGVVMVLAGLSLSRLRVSASMEAMLGSHSASAIAFHRVVTEFEAGEALLAIAEVEGRSRDLTSPITERERTATTSFADELVATLLSDPRTRGRVAWARCREDPAFQEFAAKVMLPNGTFYLGEDGTKSMIARFEPGALADQFARNESLMAAPGPAGEALGKAVLRDPLRLFELAAQAGLGAFDSSKGVEPQGTPGAEFSRDGRSVLIRIASTSSLNDLDEARTLVADVTAIAADVSRHVEQETGVRVGARLGGAYAISATASGTIRFDSIVSTLVSVVLLYLLFFLFYRRWVVPILIGVVAGAGMVTGFGMHALAGATVSPLAAAVAALLAGLGVDYGIHFVAHFDELRLRGHSVEDSAAAAARDMALPITTNCFTSIFGFASLWPSPIQMLSDFATLGTAGLLGAWLAAFTLMPALLVLTHRRKGGSRATPTNFGVIADVVAMRPKVWISTGCSLLFIVLIAAGMRGGTPRVEGDLTVLHPKPNAPLETTDEILARFTGQGEMIPVLVQVDSSEKLLPATFDAARVLSSERARSLGVVDVLGLHRLLPDPRAVAGVESTLETISADVLLGRFDAALDASAFDASAYSGYRRFVGTMLAARHAPTINDLAAYPSLAQRLFPKGSIVDGRIATMPRETVLIVRLDRPLRDRTHRWDVVTTLRQQLKAVPGATIAGLAAVSTELEETTKEGLPQSVLISMVLVLIWLVIVFRRPMDVVLALVPLLFAASFTVAFMVVIGERFNPVNSIAIPLLDGIAVDAGVFLVSVSRQARGQGRQALVEHLRPTMRAVLLASATTVTGFLSLCATHTPAIRSLGLVAAVGITISFVGAAGVLMPWLIAREPKRP